MESGKFSDFEGEMKKLQEAMADGTLTDGQLADFIELMALITKAASSEQQIECTLAVKTACVMLGIPEVGDKIIGAKIALIEGEGVGMGIKARADWEPNEMNEEQSEKFEQILPIVIRAMGMVIEQNEDGSYRLTGLIGHENCGPDGCNHKHGDVDVEAAVTAFRAELDQFEKTLTVEGQEPPKPKAHDLKDSGISKWMPRSKE